MQATSNRTYYCYNCSENFIAATHAETCVNCNSEAIQEIQNQNSVNINGQSFQVYQIPQENNQHITNNNQNQNQNVPMNNLSENRAISFMQRLSGLRAFSNNVTSLSIGPNMSYVSFGFNGNNNSSQQISFGSSLFDIFRNLRFGENTSTRATNQQICKLATIRSVKECSICQEVSEQNQNEDYNEQKSGYRLACNHQFHKSCITPWFQQTNTCPTCRHALE